MLNFTETCKSGCC